MSRYMVGVQVTATGYVLVEAETEREAMVIAECEEADFVITETQRYDATFATEHP